MPTPSKFTEARRRLILAALGCGASRRTAAKLAGVDHQTLGRWIARGRIGASTGRWRMFHDAVVAAEAAQSRPALLPLPPEVSSAELRWAEKLVFGRDWAPQDPTEWATSEPATIVLSFHDGTPIGEYRGGVDDCD